MTAWAPSRVEISCPVRAVLSFCRLGDLSEMIARPGVRSRLGGYAAPGIDFLLPADGMAAPESVTWGDLFSSGCAEPA